MRTMSRAILFCVAFAAGQVQAGPIEAETLKECTATEVVTLAADGLNQHRAGAASDFARVLKRHQPGRGVVAEKRNQIYMLDLLAGELTLIADEPVPGLTWSGSPEWSHEGSRIVFDATPGEDFNRTRVMSIEVRAGRPAVTDLGPGNCPTFSPDDKQIAFILNSGAQAGAVAGLWVMQADGSQRRRLGDLGVPSWSPDGREFLMNDFAEFPEPSVLNLEKMTTVKLKVPGYRIYSRPSWAGPGTLVSALATGERVDTIALLDVSNPAEAKISEVLWRRGEELDAMPRWPIYWPDTHRCIFIAREPKTTLYSVERGRSPRVKPVEARGKDKHLESLSSSTDGRFAFSPDGRFLLFDANRP
jgi:Tol biopolymer transport system component